MSSPNSTSPAPDFRDWSIPAVQLLRGVVYFDDESIWTILLRSQSALETYFARIGLQLVVDEAEGYAYLRQWSDEEYPPGYEHLSKVVRRVSLGYSSTVLSVILRDELRQFDEEDLNNERCVVEADVLFEQWKAFFPLQDDEVRQRRDFKATISKLQELGYVRKFQDSPETWEIRRIIKARLAASQLEALRNQLMVAATEQARDAVSEESNG